jgi:enoyl-CoA hydratase
MASIEPRMTTAYKALIDDGYALAFAEALALEGQVSRAMNGKVDARQVEARRREVMERGRAQG